MLLSIDFFFDSDIVVTLSYIEFGEVFGSGGFDFVHNVWDQRERMYILDCPLIEVLIVCWNWIM